MIRILVGLVLAASALSAQSADDPREIVRKSVERDHNNWERAREYTCERRVVEHSGGKTKITTYETGTLYGKTVNRLIARDDKPLPPEAEHKEQERFDKQVEGLRNEPEKTRREREKRRVEGRKISLEIPDAFNFKLVGMDRIDGQEAYVIEAEPRPGYRAKDSHAKLFAKFRGKLWITKSDYEWARIEAEVIDTVSFGWFIARLSPGTKLTIEQTRVNDEIWMPKLQQISVDARLMFKKVSLDSEITFSKYRKFQTESKIVSVGEK